jgi:hypothetical protein
MKTARLKPQARPGRAFDAPFNRFIQFASLRRAEWSAQLSTGNRPAHPIHAPIAETNPIRIPIRKKNQRDDHDRTAKKTGPRAGRNR